MVLLFKMFASLIFVLTVSSITFDTVDAEKFTSSQRDQEANYCLLPPYPEHGKYITKNYPSATPGESYPSVQLDVACDNGYKSLNNNTSIFCVNGYWSATMPTCTSYSYCTLIDDLSVEYRCMMPGPGLKDSRECDSMVPSGTEVTPICRSPGYFSLEVLPKMHCRDGIWDYKPNCKPACGTITQHRQLEGKSSYYVELPWHAVIYEKSNSYTQICGGSLIRSNIIISAAHCFWTDATSKLLPASYFMVAVGKLYRLHNDPRDRNSQQSNVVDIKIPSSFRVGSPYFEYDIAIVFVETPFIFHLSVRPVCLDYGYDLDRTQLTPGNKGKVASWSVDDNDGQGGQESEVLKVIDLSIIKNEVCYDNSPIYARHYLTRDKFCAGSNNESSHCEGYTGGGLAFLDSTTQRYYLRGVLTISPRINVICNILNMYISVTKHENFIKQHV